jgi:hypothetical protein
MRKGNIVFNNGSQFFYVVLSIPHLFPKLVYMAAKGDFFVQRPFLFLSLSSFCATSLFKLAGERGLPPIKTTEKQD